MRPATAWMAIAKESGAGRFRLGYWGNGFESQAAIFPTRAEAKAFLEGSSRNIDDEYRIVRCRILEGK